MEEPPAVSSFLTGFFTPRLFNTFRAPFEGRSIKIFLFRDPNATPETIEIKELYPFMTLQDLKTYIFIKKGKKAEFFPNFQALLEPVNIGEEEVSESAIADLYYPVDFLWMKAGGQGKGDIFSFVQPFERVMSSADDRFVTSTGEKKINQITDRSRMTLEDAIFGEYKEKQVILHLFLYADLYARMPSALRIAKREWFGCIEPYFPGTEISMTGITLTASQSSSIEKNVSYVTKTLELLQKLDNLIDVEEVPLYPVAMDGVKFLRLVWKEGNELAPPLETLFYTLNATHQRPFLRILPADATPITKLRTQTALKIPDLADPRLLLQWAQERSPRPDTDYLFAKIIVRPEIGTQPPLYGTLRLFEDKSADFILTPPKGLRELNVKVDLNKFSDLLEQGLEGTPLLNLVPSIGEATLVAKIQMPTDAPAITKLGMRKRLTAFASIFQEITPLPGDTPIVMLRYKAVSNFAILDRMFSFLTQLRSRRALKGEAIDKQFLETFAEEFQLSPEEAQEAMNKWILEGSEMDLMVPESKDYILRNNPGVDIAIFAQHPFYTFHLYRVESSVDLDRILTALSLLLSAEESQLSTSARLTAEYRDAQFAVVASVGAEVPEKDGPGSAKISQTPVDKPFVEGTADSLGPGNAGAASFYDTWGDLAQGTGEGDDGEEIIDLDDVEEKAVLATTKPANVPAIVKQNQPAPIVGQAVATTRADEEEEEEEDELTAPAGKGKKAKAQTYKYYLKSKLQEADQRLFVYESKMPGVKITKYVTMCQATETRQPAVLNQQQFDRMREVYSEDDITFLVYPLIADEPLPAEGSEYYTILRYGSDPANQNYYLCCEFFCIKDYILVRAEDFYSNKDRKGKEKVGESRPGAKDRGSCPFCHGLEIKVLASPAKNETVIHRKIKKKSTKRHLFVGFLKDTFHPEGFYQPCCFLDNQVLRISDKEFSHIRSATEVPVEDEEDELRGTTVSATSALALPMLDYGITLAKAHKKYIVGPEKFPLKLGETDGPQIGLLPPLLDIYFSQDPGEFVSREYNRMELKPDAKAFLRIGVENRSTYLPDSFLACIAPFLHRNNAQQVKDRLLEVIVPRIFMFLNYGNLVLEFYDPSDPIPPDGELRLWASKELSVDLTKENVDAVQRIWMSFHRFKAFLESRLTLKEYRQFAQVLALPSLITPRGLVLIILDIILDKDGQEKVEVRCPPFGYDMEQYAGADIAIALHHHTGIWEPIFFSYNNPPTGRFAGVNEGIITFQRALEAAWPPILRKRVYEFTSRCAGSGRAAYTSQAGIDPMAMVPLSTAIKALGKDPAGIIRDAYNHIVGLTYRAVPGKTKAGLVALPVVDDGTIVNTQWTHLDWDDFTPAPMDQIVQYYNTYFNTAFSLYPRYKITRRVKSRGTEKYEALKLANGLFIPASPPKDESLVNELPLEYVDEMEWSLNREIAFAPTDKDKVPKEIRMRAEEADFAEIFEHLRLTFSGWFSSLPEGGDLREKIKQIIFNNTLPLFERRKRLEITLGQTILSWMDDTIPSSDNNTTLLRVDCSLQAQPNCTGRCVWRQGTGTNTNDLGKCLIHSPKEARLGSRNVNGPRLLMLRLLEELLRFPARRQQLLEGNISTLAHLKNAVQIGDQWILPENTLAWFDLLRLDWVTTSEEKKKFFEEMTTPPEKAPPRVKTLAPAPVEEGEERIVTEPQGLPSALQELFGLDDPKLANVFLYRTEDLDLDSPLRPYLIPLGTSPEELGVPEEADALTKEATKKLVMETRRPIVQIDIRTDEPVIESYGLIKYQKTDVPYILVASVDGPGVLSAYPDKYQAILPDAMPEGLYNIVVEERVGLSGNPFQVTKP